MVNYMEYLDIYDENGNYLGKEDRNIVHRDALWHNTVHCWLYDKKGNIYFQIRKDENKLYTTASGHVKAGETIKEGFGREVKEEIGIDINYNEAVLVNVIKYTLDKLKKDGTVFRDRAFSNVYVCEFNGKYSDFDFDDDELNGLVKVNAEDALELLNKKLEKVNCEKIVRLGGKNKSSKEILIFDDFLVNEGETAIRKYGEILEKVIELTSK